MNPWYQGPLGRSFMDRTNDGQLMFLWEAIHKNGLIVRMYDDPAFTRALTDPEFVPNPDLRRSVDELDKSKVIQFRLWPIALTKEVFPHITTIYVTPNLAKGERIKSFWLTDYSPRLRTYLRRTVVGIERASPQEGEEKQDLIVVSPSGSIVSCHSEDQSFEGE